MSKAQPPRHAALLPPRSLAGPALMAVTMVMTFLACLALGSSVPVSYTHLTLPTIYSV